MIASLAEKLRIRLWLRDQHVNQRLRDHFRTRHRVDVGLYSYGCFDQWRMPGPIRVGRYCSIANSVRSAPVNHPLSALSTHPCLFDAALGVVDTSLHYDEVLVIEDDVWIGHNAVILPGCRFIGRGAVIGAGSIVTKDVSPYAIVAGNPARKLRDRFDPELAAAIDASKWWEMDFAQLRQLAQDDADVLFHPTRAALARLQR